MKKKLSQILSLIVCLLMVAAVSLRRDGKLLGHDFRAKQKAETLVKNDTLRMEPDGTMVINTTSLGKDISGYGGAVPLEIYVNKKGVITQVKALPNGETPEFFGRASALFNAWKGKSLKEAETMQVDAASGATYSSKAIIANMQRGLQYAGKASAKAQTIQCKEYSRTDCGADGCHRSTLCQEPPLSHRATSAQHRRTGFLVRHDGVL